MSNLTKIFHKLIILRRYFVQGVPDKVVELSEQDRLSVVGLADVYMIERYRVKLPTARVGALRRNKCEIDPQVSGWLGLTEADHFRLEFVDKILEGSVEARQGGIVGLQLLHLHGREEDELDVLAEARDLRPVVGSRVENDTLRIVGQSLQIVTVRLLCFRQHLLYDQPSHGMT